MHRRITRVSAGTAQVTILLALLGLFVKLTLNSFMELEERALP
jgi:hypothetical protein